MVICNFCISLPNSLNLHHYSLFKLAILFFTILPSSTPLSFNFTRFQPADTNRTITITGNASISDQGIQLTADPDIHGRSSANNTGRATYIEPLHLWNETTGNVTDFTTHFTFLIKTANISNLGQGLAFFLSPNGSGIPPDSSGGRLGLESQRSQENNDFVAVEFDTYRNNEWEEALTYNHVAILINSMSSVANVTWDTTFESSRAHEAWIKYDSRTTNLSVSFTSFTDDGIVRRNNLYYIVNLRNFLPEWVTFGFSAATGEVFEKNNIQSWEFSTTKATSTIPGGGGNKTRIGLILGLIIGSCVFVGCLCLLGFFVWKKKSKGSKKEVEFHKDTTGPKKFLYKELARATNNFSEREKLGEGGFGEVYKGFLKELKSTVAIKKISRGSKQGINEYASEVKIISRLRHRNLVQLKGWSHEKRELLLVYEYMANGSLDLHLYKEKFTVLTWGVRYKIVKGLGSALLYLHEEWEQCVLHRDIKPSNVMLDLDFNAKLGDFGLAKLVDHEKGSPTTTNLAGTMGYMAIEYVFTRKASKESDVYSFGVVCLEIASGRKPTDFLAEGSYMSMVEWIWGLYGMGNILEAADQKLCGGFDMQEMERLLVVGLWCAHPDYNLRPSVRQATLVLNFESPLPILPLRMPLIPTNFSTRPTPVNMVASSSFTSSSDGTTMSSMSSQSTVDGTQRNHEIRTASSYTYGAATVNSSTDFTPSNSMLYTM